MLNAVEAPATIESEGAVNSEKSPLFVPVIMGVESVKLPVPVFAIK